MNLVIKAALVLLIISGLDNEREAKLLIMMEDEGTGEELIYLNSSIRLLNGQTCNEFTTHGSVLQSGAEQIQRIITNREDQQKQSYGLICHKCIRECFIIRHVLHLITTKTTNETMSVPMMLVKPQSGLNLRQKNVFRMLPQATRSIDAFFTLCRLLNWNRIGVVISSDSHQAVHITNYLKYPHEDRNVSISLIIDLMETPKRRIVSTRQVLKSLIKSGTKITLLTVPFSDVAEILCLAHEVGLSWPEYAWIVYIQEFSSSNYSCKYHTYLEGVIFLTFDFNSRNNQFALSTFLKFLTQETNKLKMDAIELLKQAANLSSDISQALRSPQFYGITGNITFDSTQSAKRAFVFVQVVNKTVEMQVQVKGDIVINNKWLHRPHPFPSSDLPIRVNTIYPLWLNIIEVIVTFASVTIVLILFIYFRNEPEVRATSWLLSLLMIFSCYLVVVNLLTHAVHTSLPPTPHFNTCSFLVWVSGYGVPQTLLIAVLLVKMLRVFHIFHNSRQLGKMSSDFAMAVYVLLILSPNMLILLVMTALDSYKVNILETVRGTHVEIIYVCKGDLTVYFQTLLVYLLILVFFTAIVAWSTRKLRLKHFRDAKKVNGFFIVFVFVIVPGSVLYGVFRSDDLYLHGYIIIHVCYNILVFSCLGFLFVPKIYPVIRRRYFRTG